MSDLPDTARVKPIEEVLADAVRRFPGCGIFLAVAPAISANADTTALFVSNIVSDGVEVLLDSILTQIKGS